MLTDGADIGADMDRSVTVDRSVIEHLLANSEVLREFPIFRVFLQRKSRVSSCCGGKRRRVTHTAAHDIRQAKVSLMGLPPAKMRRLKAILKADILVFHMPTRRGHETVRV